MEIKKAEKLEALMKTKRGIEVILKRLNNVKVFTSIEITGEDGYESKYSIIFDWHGDEEERKMAKSVRTLIININEAELAEIENKIKEL